MSAALFSPKPISTSCLANWMLFSVGTALTLGKLSALLLLMPKTHCCCYICLDSHCTISQCSWVTESDSPSPPQPLPRGLHLHESWEESKLWLHKLWQLRLGLPGSIPTHDTGLLGKPLHAGKTDMRNKISFFHRGLLDYTLVFCVSLCHFFCHENP